MKLSTRIFALAFINLALLAGVFLVFAHFQFHLNPRSFLVAPAEDRVRDVARSVAYDLSQTRTEARTSLMARYAATYGVDFYLFDNDGNQLAGKPVRLPPGVRSELLVRPPGEQPPPERAAEAPAATQPPPAPSAPNRPRPGPPPPRADAPADRPGPPPPFGRGDGPFPPPGRRGGPPPEGPDGRGPRVPGAFGPPPGRGGRGQEPDGFGPPLPEGASGARRPRRPPPRAAARAASGQPAATGRGATPALRPRPALAGAAYQTSQRSEAGLYWAMTRLPVLDASGGDLVRGTLIMVAPSFWGTPLFFDFKPFLGALAAAIAVFLLCWLPFIRGLSRSISRLTENTGRIAQGDFENHLPENRGDEIGQLSISINRMADRLSGFVTGQKRFLGDIAHELSAPIARIQFALGILEQRAAGEQTEALGDLQEEIRQMSGLVGELLSFSKAGLDSGKAALVPAPVAPLAQQAAAREASGNAQISVSVPDDLIALAEPNLFLRALSNLVRNAVRYAGASGPIEIVGRRSGDCVLITVADSGPGLPPGELDRVFMPFYRPDTSRNRDTGGAGLGLAIVKSCVESSGGTVECRNREPRGLEVTITLKAAPPPDAVH